MASDVVDSGGAAHRGANVRAEQWERRFLALTVAWLAFETLSGLSIYLLPFSVPNQWLVLVHTAAGVVLLPPVLFYQCRHLAAYRKHPRTALKLMGYLGAAAVLVAIVSGLVLTAQAIGSPRISYAWAQAHVIATFALIAFGAPHLLVVLLRDGRPAIGSVVLQFAARRAGWRSLAGCGALFACVALAWLAYPGESFDNRFPPDYSFKYGPNRPFAPSLARSESGGAYDSRSFAGSESCGTSGCHQQIADEWRVSAHRWAAMDTAFQRIQEEMAKQNGAESTRYCGGCHDPISLFSGTKNVFTADLTNLAGYNEGVSCLVCHSIRKTDVLGNAQFVVAQPSRYLFELRDGAPARFLRDFLIRAYPRQHVADLSKRLFKTPEYCAACHKQFIDQEVNNVGWVQLQNQYDNWKNSRWNHAGDPKKTIECRECHMPLTASDDPASGDALDYNRAPGDGRHRSHRFLGANQVMPAMLRLPGAEQQIELVTKWLRGEYEIPEIAEKWTTGPAVGIELKVPEHVEGGRDVTVRAVVTSNKVGHDFPTGPLDIIQSWVELTAWDVAGNVVFRSGHRDPRHFIEPGAFMFKAEPVDQYGNLIDRHNLWEMVGVRYRRALFPGFSDTAEYMFRCPGDATPASQSTRREESFRVPVVRGQQEVRLTARLLYRKVDQYLLNFMFGESLGLTAPITELARAEARIPVRAARAPAELTRGTSPRPVAPDE
jgi:hypothetical protein